MQINIDKKSGVFISIIAALIAVIAVLLLGNNKSDQIEMGHGDHSMMHHGALDNSNFTGTDVMFSQMMIPHHEQAVLMSDLALSKSKNAEVLAIAKRIKDAQAPEIELMKGWLNSAGATLDMGHEMGMGGMLSESDISTLNGATGKEFDRLFLTGMIGHHEGALHMVQMISDSSNDAVRQLGINISKLQSAEIRIMQKILKTVE